MLILIIEIIIIPIHAMIQQATFQGGKKIYMHL
jgi:hypothetical protein